MRHVQEVEVRGGEDPRHHHLLLGAVPGHIRQDLVEIFVFWLIGVESVFPQKDKVLVFAVHPLEVLDQILDVPPHPAAGGTPDPSVNPNAHSD